MLFDMVRPKFTPSDAPWSMHPVSPESFPSHEIHIRLHRKRSLCDPHHIYCNQLMRNYFRSECFKTNFVEVQEAINDQVGVYAIANMVVTMKVHIFRDELCNSTCSGVDGLSERQGQERMPPQTRSRLDQLRKHNDLLSTVK